MSAIAVDLIAEARRHGVRLIPTPTGRIKARAATPPPLELVTKLKAYRAELILALAEAEVSDFVEPAAIVEHDGAIPRAWAEGFAQLHPDYPPGDVPLRRWQRFIDDIGRFLNGPCCAVAAALGWGPLDLFGCDRKRPFARVDHAGLLWLLNGGQLVELDRHRAIIETTAGTRQTFRRRPAAVGELALAWEPVQPLANGSFPRGRETQR